MVFVMSILVLRKEIKEKFQDAWKLNDKGHQEEHYENVFQCGLAINDSLGGRYDPKLIMLAAYFIDLFAWSRVNHHELSHLWVSTTDHPIIGTLSKNNRYLVSIACLQHRASFKGHFSHEFAELISAADREFPGDVDHMLQRAIDYRLKWNPEMSAGQRRDEAIKHLKDKFGYKGYSRYPSMYNNAFKGELEKQRELIEAL